MTILAATGHRPNKLGGYGIPAMRKLEHFARSYLKSRPEIIQGNLHLISGMALGWDTAWALAAIELQIPFIAAVPFTGQERQWPTESQKMYGLILQKASTVVLVSEGLYAPTMMQERNEWMVDHCDEVVALWDGSRGGTYNCIQYAKKFNKPIINLWDHYDLHN